MSELTFRLPDVGEGLSEGEILQWLVGPGDHVRRDQTVVEVQTDKSVVELPAPEDGVIRTLGGEVGDILPVGEILLVMDTTEASGAPAKTGTSTSAAPPATAPASAPASAPRAAAATPAADAAGRPRRVRAAPATRKLALECGVALEGLEGSGPGGRITRGDVERAAGEQDGGAEPPVGEGTAARSSAPSTRAPSSAEDEVVPLRGLRRQIAKTMTTAWREVPHITDIREVDATALVAARRRLAEHLAEQLGPDERFSYLPLLIKAVVTTLASSPKFNASLDLEGETVTYHGRRNIGVATATDDGLIVPVLHDADHLGLAEIADRVAALAQAARSRSLTVDQTAKGTCTVTNFGSFGGWIATPIIRPPEAAIVGFGRIADRVVAVDGVPAVRPVLPMSVSADHRLIDGDDMGAFLNRLTALLTDPILLLAGEQ